MKLTGAAILVSRAMKFLQAAPAAYPFRSATEGEVLRCLARAHSACCSQSLWQF
jgi:hypothetical protein